MPRPVGVFMIHLAATASIFSPPATSAVNAMRFLPSFRGPQQKDLDLVESIFAEMKTNLKYQAQEDIRKIGEEWRRMIVTLNTCSVRSLSRDALSAYLSDKVAPPGFFDNLEKRTQSGPQSAFAHLEGLAFDGAHTATVLRRLLDEADAQTLKRVGQYACVPFQDDDPDEKYGKQVDVDEEVGKGSRTSCTRRDERSLDEIREYLQNLVRTLIWRHHRDKALEWVEEMAAVVFSAGLAKLQQERRELGEEQAKLEGLVMTISIAQVSAAGIAALPTATAAGTISINSRWLEEAVAGEGFGNVLMKGRDDDSSFIRPRDEAETSAVAPDYFDLREMLRWLVGARGFYLRGKVVVSEGRAEHAAALRRFVERARQALTAPAVGDRVSPWGERYFDRGYTVRFGQKGNENPHATATCPRVLVLSESIQKRSVSQLLQDFDRLHQGEGAAIPEYHIVRRFSAFLEDERNRSRDRKYFFREQNQFWDATSTEARENCKDQMQGQYQALWEGMSELLARIEAAKRRLKEIRSLWISTISSLPMKNMQQQKKTRNRDVLASQAPAGGVGGVNVKQQDHDRHQRGESSGGPASAIAFKEAGKHGHGAYRPAAPTYVTVVQTPGGPAATTAGGASAEDRGYLTVDPRAREADDDVLVDMGEAGILGRPVFQGA